MAMRSAFFIAATLLSAALPAAAQQFSRGNALVNESAYELDRENWRVGTELAQQALKSGEIMLENIPGAYNNLCIGLTGLRKFDEAIQACDKAVEMKPRSWSFYNNRANIFFYLGQFDRALAEYYKAMTFSSGSNVLMNNIGLALQYRKNYGPRPGNPGASEKSS
jgi:tetratricopeptide (TPR) repeat protein